MSEPLTPDTGTEPTEPVTLPENTEVVEPTVSSTVTPTDEAAESSTEQPAPENASPEQPQQPDYKQKASQQGRENILLNERVNVAQSRINELTKTDTPTDEAMRKLYPEWDQLDDYNKRVLIRQEATAMQQANIIAKQQEIDARQKLEDQLDDVIDNSEFSPKLKGKEADFRRFARNPKNRGIAAQTLAKAFLFDAEDEAVTPPPPAPTEALPVGSGGPREDLKPKKVSLEEAAQIRKTDYKRYMELVKNKQIEDFE